MHAQIQNPTKKCPFKSKHLLPISSSTESVRVGNFSARVNSAGHLFLSTGVQGSLFPVNCLYSQTRVGPIQQYSSQIFRVGVLSHLRAFFFCQNG